jgi:hypothetical protein
MRKLLGIALVTALSLAASLPAPAIDFVCSCALCANGQGPACRPGRGPAPGFFVSCADYWAQYCK